MEAKAIAMPALAPTPETGHTDCYRLVLLNSAGTHVILQHEDDRYFLPQIRIPQFTRPAEQITSLVRNNWSTITTLLWSAQIESADKQSYYAVLHLYDETQQMPGILKSFPIREALTCLDSAQASLIETGHARALTTCPDVDPEPFSRLGWIHRLQDWINVVVGPSAVESRRFIQYNGSGAFALIRFETNAMPLWFKAVGPPNLREFPITLLLSRLFPDYLPKILASDPLLNGWLMEGAGELTLGECEDKESWGRAVQRLARLQIESIGRASELVQAGSRDARTPTLASLVVPFFDAMTSLMQRQTKKSPSPLTSEELTVVASTIEHALLLLQEHNMPDTLGHADFNPGNVLLDGSRCVFTDWAEAFVGHPFLTFEYLLNYLRKCCPALVSHEPLLLQCYSQYWHSVASPDAIRRALRLSRLVAVFAYATVGNAWGVPEEMDEAVAGYLRSLVRRMHQEVTSLRRDLCLT
jgi:hypothetical protein